MNKVDFRDDFENTESCSSLRLCTVRPLVFGRVDSHPADNLMHKIMIC